MTIAEIFSRILINIIDLLIPMGFAAAATLVVVLILVPIGSKTWLDKGSFKYLSIFYCLEGYDRFRLAASWLMFCLTVVYLAMFQVLQLAHYVIFAVLLIVYSIDTKRKVRFLANIWPGAIVGAVLFVLNILLKYIKELAPGTVFTIGYIILCLFLTMFSFYVFMKSLENISNGRRADKVGGKV